MLNSIGLSSCRARCSACSDQGYQSDRIVRVLEQVRAGFVDQGVGVLLI